MDVLWQGNKKNDGNMEYFLGEIENPNGTKEYKLVKAESLIKAHERLRYVVGGYAKNFKITMTL